MPPNRGPAPVKLFRKDDAEVLTLGPITCYVFEDGSNTDNRVGAVLLMIPPGAKGPPMHWHRFHDELFFVTKGAVTPDAPVNMVVRNRAVTEIEPTHGLGIVRFIVPDGSMDGERVPGEPCSVLNGKSYAVTSC
jgi:hypothetical protein